VDRVFDETSGFFGQSGASHLPIAQSQNVRCELDLQLRQKFPSRSGRIILFALPF
jgi:hypothetical protein